MKPRVRLFSLVLGMLVLFVIPCTVRAVAPPPLPDLGEFRTVESAITTRISGAALPEPRQPAYLGIHTEPRSGALTIVHVEPGSPAFRAGLESGDVVKTLDGQAMTQAADLGEVIRTRGPGDRLKVAVIRDGRAQEVEVVLAAVSRPLSAGMRVVLGIQGKDVPAGVQITSVTAGLPAAVAGVKKDDVIVQMGGTSIRSVDRLSESLQSYRPGDVVRLLIQRDGKEQELSAKLMADPAAARGMGWNNRRMGMFSKPVYRLAVVAIEFPDAKHNSVIKASDWEQSLFSKGTYTSKSVTGQQVFGSLNDYYQEQSCGAFRVEGKVFDWITVKEKKADYANNSNRMALLTEALDKLLARDGAEALKGFDGIFYLYAGDRGRTARGGLFWPHRSFVPYKGERWSYFICPEGGARMGNISVICHEFGHMLGLPDLYAAPDTSVAEGLGVWCVMAEQLPNGRPQHLCAWSKEQLGWLKPTVIDPRTPQKLLLSPVVGSTRECFKVLITPNASEYLLLENRIRKNFDRDLPGEGLLIWRVVDGRPVLEESHGITTPEGPKRFLGSIPYPSASNNAFTPFTTPSSKAVKGNGLPVHITNIRRLADGRISFFVGYEYQ
jgi:M6 family metalloprotease-like protein